MAENVVPHHLPVAGPPEEEGAVPSSPRQFAVPPVASSGLADVVAVESSAVVPVG